jgi:hypothetical protein
MRLRCNIRATSPQPPQGEGDEQLTIHVGENTAPLRTAERITRSLAEVSAMSALFSRLARAAASATLCAPFAVFAQSAVYSTAFDSTEGWPDSDRTGDLTAVYTVVAGEYLISPLQSGVYGLARAPVSADSADMAIDADVRLSASQGGSRAGLACRVGSGQNFVAFTLTGAGEYEIVRVRNGRGLVLSSGALGFDPAEGARLHAECRGTQLRFSANGHLLGTATDPDADAADGAGLLSVAPVVASTNAAFDNFALQSLGGSPASGRTATLRSTPPSTQTSTHTSSSQGSGGYGNTGAAIPAIDDLALFEDSGAGRPGDRRSLFPTGRQRVYLVMELAQPVRSPLTVRWVAIRGTAENPLQETNHNPNGSDRRVWLYAERNWARGLYRADLYANGVKLDEREFTVE